MAGRLPNKTVALVTTASEDKERNQFAQLGRRQLIELGCTVMFVDLETDPNFDFSSYGIIYVNGGNTFYLLQYALATNFGQSVQALLDRGGIYIGVSAGSIIVCPDISIVDYTAGDPNEIGMTDFTALGLVDFYLDVHYGPESEAALAAYEREYGRKVERLTDDQALLVENGAKRRIMTYNDKK